MKRCLTFLALMLALAAGLTAKTPQRYEINVGDFQSLKVVDGLNVDYKISADSAGKVVFFSPRSLASSLIVSNKDGKLKLEISSDASGMVNLPVITVYSRSLESVENSGDSTVRILSRIKAPKFAARVVGNGHLSVRDIDATDVKAKVQMGKGRLMISGKCNFVKLSSIGTGIIEADGLKANVANVTVNGTGAVGVWATDQLTVSGTGTTTIYYKGDPEIKKKMLLGPKLSPLSD